jgi:hypothetical protein
MAALWVMRIVVVPAVGVGQHREHHLAGGHVERPGGLVAQEHVGAFDQAGFFGDSLSRTARGSRVAWACP